MTAPVACQWLNYRGDRTRGAVGQVLGPNAFRELMTVVEATYDPATDRTRLGLVYGVVHVEDIDP